MQIAIEPPKGSEAYETIKQLELLDYKFEGMPFYVTAMGFFGWLRAISPLGERQYMIKLSGREEPVWTVEIEKWPKQEEYSGEPDPCDLAREYNELQYQTQIF